MGLKYNILWVDDHKDEYVEVSINNRVLEYAKSLFLDANLDFYDEVDDAENALSSKKYDLIFSDYNIGAKNGDTFIKEIREKSVNVEVLFYSAQDDLPLLGLDRISFLKLIPNTAYTQLEDKMKSMIDLTLEKLNDLTNLRGLVMAEVSELDAKMEFVIQRYYVDCKSNKKRNSFNEHIVADSESSLKKSLQKDGCNKECIHIWRNKKMDEIIPRLDSSQKARTIKLIMGELNFNYDSRKANFYEDYLEDVINVRNNLAHCVSEISDGKEILKTRNNPCVVFSQQEITDIRKNLQKYSDVFENLTTLIT